MKQRIFNTFYRKVNNKTIAYVFANGIHFFLKILYWIIRPFLKEKLVKDVNDARNNLMQCSAKPEMDYSCIYNSNVDKDLSIIVPAYNAAETIRQCIESVVCQDTNVEYELLIVNDGSTDDTKKIVESFENIHIRLINQENRGFSGARNRGIEESKGRYLMFLDADDLLVDNCIETMFCKIKGENADIIQGSFGTFSESTMELYKSILNNKILTDNKEIVNNPGYPWAKIYKRELFNNVRFPLNVWFEDTVVCMLLYRLCRKMVVIDDVVYAYRINPNGITLKARHNKKCVDHYWVMEHTLKQAMKIGLSNDKIQYDLVKSHMSTLLYRRLSLMDIDVIESAFVLACDLLDKIRPKDYFCDESFICKDIERAFETRNYKLWKWASFVV